MSLSAKYYQDCKYKLAKKDEKQKLVENRRVLWNGKKALRNFFGVSISGNIRKFFRVGFLGKKLRAEAGKCAR